MITTKHRGHDITYSENGDEWNCFDVGYSSPSLAKVRAKIDKMYLDLRKRSAVKCYELAHWDDRIESSVVDFIASVAPRHQWEKETTHRVAVVAQRSGRERQSRAEKSLSDLMPDTPEANSAYEYAMKLRKLAKQANAEADAAFKAIPRLSLEDVAELKRIRETEGNIE